jgi:hypothetical protein
MGAKVSDFLFYHAGILDFETQFISLLVMAGLEPKH